MSGLIFVDGRWREGAGDSFASIDPATGETVWEGRAADEADAADAVAAARRAFADWSRRPRAERIEAMQRDQAALVERTEAFAAVISRETGKPLWETRTEVTTMVNKVDISVKAYQAITFGK